MALPFLATRPALRSHALDGKSVHQFIETLVGEDLHALRVLSLANGVLGVLHSASLAVHAIGEALAAHRDLVPKHAIKGDDRFLSNTGIDPEVLGPQWVNFVRDPANGGSTA